MRGRAGGSPAEAPGGSRARWGAVLPVVCALLVAEARTLAAEPNAAPVSASSTRLESLLRQFSAAPGLVARFRETKRLQLLREPLHSSGVLHFAPPDRLLRRVEEPVASTLLVVGDEVAIRGAGGDWNVDLDAHPAVRSFVDGFRLLLRGDLDELQNAYAIEFESSEDPGDEAWKIRLVPRSEELRGVVTTIAIVGRGRIVRELRVVETNGDETLDEFFDVDADRRFSDAELQSLFRAPDP